MNVGAEGPTLPDPSASAPAPMKRGRSHPARRIALAVGVVVGLFAVVLATRLHQSPAYRGLGLGRAAPAFDLPTLDGVPVRLANLRGKTVIVNFWNSWCIPCREEHPALATFFERHRHEPDFAMIGIVRDDTEPAARRWVEEQHVDWTIALDPGERASLDFATTGQPETYAISPDGVLTAKQISRVDVTNLEQMLARARGTG